MIFIKATLPKVSALELHKYNTNTMGKRKKKKKKVHCFTLLRNKQKNRWIKTEKEIPGNNAFI